MNRSAPISLLLQAKAGPGLAPPENSQARVPESGGGGAEYGLPEGSGSENDGCSGQMPVSSTPTITLSPALSCPPSRFHTVGAPMKVGVRSVSRCCSSSGYTATTPGSLLSASI